MTVLATLRAMVKDLPEIPHVGFGVPDRPVRDDRTPFRLRLFAAKLIEWRVAEWLSRLLYRAADRLDQAR